MARSTPRATSIELLRNERLAMTLWTLPPGTATGVHVHAFDYAVLPLTSGSLRVTALDDSSAEAELVARQPYFRSAGARHNVSCSGATTVEFVEIELL